MKTVTTNTDVYKFAELSEDAQQTAIEKLWYINVDNDLSTEFILDDAKEIGKLMGIDITNIYYSGFSSQGDGACFEGSYQYRKGSVKLVKDYAPKDTVLHNLVTRLQAVQKTNFYGLLAYVKHSGNYYHQYCTNISVEHNYNNISISSETEDEVIEILRDFMAWIYDRLEKEYNYLTTKEAIIETIEANDYDFTEDGKIY